MLGAGRSAVEAGDHAAVTEAVVARAVLTKAVLAEILPAKALLAGSAAIPESKRHASHHRACVP